MSDSGAETVNRAPTFRKAPATEGPLSVLIDRPPEVRFSFEDHPHRMGRALGVSVLGHVALVGLVLLIAALLPKPAPTEWVRDLTHYDIVWIPTEGPGGGGGGGGNESPEPPREVEMPGQDAITVPVAERPEFEQPEEQEEPDPPQQMEIPAKTLASSAETLPGVLDGLPAFETDSQGSGLGGGGGGGEGTGIGPGRGSGLGPGEGGGTGGGVYRPGSGVTLPRVIREVRPQYTADAMRAKIQGAVLLEAVVLPDGTVGDVQITRSLDPVFGLDEEAVNAAKQWRFVPGMRFGQPVSVLVVIELTFTLR